MVWKGRPRKMKSKRMSCRLKFKIEKKVKEHHRQVRKADKKKINMRPRRKKDPGVPNMAPFKEQVLREAEERKIRAEEQKKRQKEQRQQLANKKRNLESFAKDAVRRQKEFENKEALMKEISSKTYDAGSGVESSRKAYYKEFRKVVDASDVILEVLDARDPLGCRCPQVEQAVLASGTNKKIVLVLNKIDLIPKELIEKWLKHLRNEFPTVAFKASTQTQKQNLSRSKVQLSQATKELVESSACLGSDSLMKLLANYCRSADIKTSITVGVVGFPNVGKSSLINSLKRAKSCVVGATPGVTKSMQQVQLDKHVKLLDCPGIVMATGASDVAMVLRNCVKIETLADPVSPVAAILKRCNKQQLMLYYSVPNFNNVNEFLALLARKQGKLKKGGVPAIEKAAKTVLTNWNSGKITYYTHPPEQHKLPTHISADIVGEMSKAFDIGSLENDEKMMFEGLQGPSESGVILFESTGPTEGDVKDVEFESVDEDEDEEENEDDDSDAIEIDESDADENKELADITIEVPGKKVGTKQPLQKSSKKEIAHDKIEGNLQVGKQMRKEFKKMKKQRRRSDALATKLSDNLTAAMDFSLSADHDDEDAYDFSKDYK
ncbi:nucleostemin-like protein [Saccoglossus kowalevskii]|uniref:Nucleostemin-like protein n=1 Tax=Saccoglossus kowalevskii TaxID=10224 RepID=D1LXA1_SACKO|nr:nucleostemin-like protein [Saccoglossus kowalevskii]ACY92607.1 nucleostemin-like protein [Saccoglossus kowalevskii]